MKIVKGNYFDNNFDIAIISFPSTSNLTNFILANTIKALKPKLVARFLFDDLPVTIVNNGQITSPSIDFYSKKIKNKNYALVIGNYRPKEIEAYKKMYDIIGKSKEIVILNEFTRKTGELFYLRYEYRKSKIKIEKIKSKFKKIENAIIKGIPSIMFELAKKKKRNITVLFFNTNIEYLNEGIKVFNEVMEFDQSKEIIEEINRISKIEKNNQESELMEGFEDRVTIKKQKINYIG